MVRRGSAGTAGISTLHCRCRDQICPTKQDLVAKPAAFRLHGRGLMCALGGVVICSLTSYYWYYTWPFARSFACPTRYHPHYTRTMASAQALFNNGARVTAPSND